MIAATSRVFVLQMFSFNAFYVSFTNIYCNFESVRTTDDSNFSSMTIKMSKTGSVLSTTRQLAERSDVNIWGGSTTI